MDSFKGYYENLYQATECDPFKIKNRPSTINTKKLSEECIYSLNNNKE